ncbi:conserved hypothetical protein (C-terminal fragment), partial [Sporisorium reilianum SRZ2]
MPTCFPDNVGRLVLDGTEDVRDWQTTLGAFGLDALDNIAASFHDGFLGECAAGPHDCALAQPLPGQTALPSKTDLIAAFDDLFANLVQRPMPSFTPDSGPMLITYTQIVALLYTALYAASSWPPLASALHALLHGNATSIALYLDASSWEYDPAFPSIRASSDELGMMVICADQFYAPLPAGYDVATNGEQWYLDTWARMVEQSEIGGNGRFYDILPCRQWNRTFAAPKEVFRGALNHTLAHPVLLVAETYDPATPLRNGRRLLREMGTSNARLIALDAFSHSSRDLSKCVVQKVRQYMLHGVVPQEAETRCEADSKPYRSGGAANEWQAHVEEMRALRWRGL